MSFVFVVIVKFCSLFGMVFIGVIAVVFAMGYGLLLNLLWVMVWGLVMALLTLVVDDLAFDFVECLSGLVSVAFGLVVVFVIVILMLEWIFVCQDFLLATW
jgi:hypothetical protein